MSIPVAASVQIDAVNLPEQPFVTSQSLGPYQANGATYVLGVNAGSLVAMYKSLDSGITWAQVATTAAYVGGLGLDTAIDGDTIWVSFYASSVKIVPFNCLADAFGATVDVSPSQHFGGLNILPFGTSDAIVLYNSVGTTPGSTIRLTSYSGAVSMDIAGPTVVFGDFFEPAALAVDGATIYAIYYRASSFADIVELVVATITGGAVVGTTSIGSYTHLDARIIAARPTVWHSQLIVPVSIGIPGDPATVLQTTVAVYSSSLPVGTFSRVDVEVMPLTLYGAVQLSVTNDDNLALFWVRGISTILYQLSADPTSWGAGSVFYDQTGELSAERDISGGAMPDGTFAVINSYTPAAGPYNTMFFIGSEAATVLAYCF